jgi:hypothetical protein
LHLWQSKLLANGRAGRYFFLDLLKLELSLFCNNAFVFVTRLDSSIERRQRLVEVCG